VAGAVGWRELRRDMNLGLRSDLVLTGLEKSTLSDGYRMTEKAGPDFYIRRVDA
jgi:hypothetical protein